MSLSPDAPPPYGIRARVFHIRLLLCALLLLTAEGGNPGAAAEAVRLLVLGDSLTAGFGLAPEDAFPARLERRLAAEGLHVEVLNAGVSGDTTAGGRARLGWALADKPDAVIVVLGGNDALRGIDPAETRANLDAILAELGRRRLKVLLTGMMAPRNLGPDYARTFDAIYPELAAKHHVALDPFFLEGVALNPALNQPDGIHPNPRGVAAIVERMLPAVRRLLAGG